MKEKILIIGISMNAAGTERSFISFASKIDYDKYDVELLLAAKEGPFLDRVPSQIKISEMGEYAEIFKITRNNSFSVIRKLFLKKNPFFVFKILPYTIKMLGRGNARSYAANRIWLELMKKMPMHKGEYDIAIAYWGDHTMFYMIDKVKARKKISWLHFDYDEPPREDALYQPYFEKCDKVVTVSREIERSLGDRFPGIREKTETIENFINESEIKSKAKEPCSYREGFDGKVLLSVGRICAQKGFDLAIPAVAKVHREQKNIRYYIIGEGEEEYKDMLLEKISNLGADDFIKILPATDNPFKYMARCDVYLQPSRHEGKPITVEEAKILERPLCLTNYKSAREQVENVKKFTICSISEEGIYNGIKEILEKTE